MERTFGSIVMLILTFIFFSLPINSTCHAKAPSQAQAYSGPSSCQGCIAKGDCAFTDWGSGSNARMVFVVLESCWNQMTKVDKENLAKHLKQRAVSFGLRESQTSVLLSKGKDRKGYLLMDKEISLP